WEHERSHLVQTEFVRVLRGLQIICQIRLRYDGRYLAWENVQLFLWQTRCCTGAQPEISQEYRLRSVPDPICNAEGAELGEVPIVKTQYKMCFLIAYVLECVAV